MKILRRGSKGFHVLFLQRLLNKAAIRDRSRDQRLVEDGIFGPLTEASLRAFQSRHRPLVVDGIAGPKSLKALGLSIEREHLVFPVGQPTNATCWSAAASMLIGWSKSISQVIGPGGAVLVRGGLQPSVDNIETFGRSLGWEMPRFTPQVMQLVNMVQRTPLWIAAGGQNWAHAVVLSGVYSDGTFDGTTFRIHDPWPPYRGSIYGSFANPLTMFAADGRTRVDASLQTILIPR